MAEIRHRVGIAAPQARVDEAVATREGLSGWWTREVDGDPGVGGILQSCFGQPEPGAVMEVIALTPPTRRMALRPGTDEWVSTRLTFDFSPAADETVLLFTHADWREPVEFMHHCSTKWAYSLLGLKASLEGGNGTAYPDDMKISRWD